MCIIFLLVFYIKLKIAGDRENTATQVLNYNFQHINQKITKNRSLAKKEELRFTISTFKVVILNCSFLSYLMFGFKIRNILYNFCFKLIKIV